MNEHAPKNHEELKDFDQLAEASEHMLPTGEKVDVKKAERDSANSLAEARHEAEEITKSHKHEKQLDPIKALEIENNDDEPAHIQTNVALKGATYQRLMTRLQKDESLPARTLSKVIHQPVVRAVSEVSAKTISRPSGMLGGGLLALIGSSGYLWLAKNQGFKYNYAVFLALFFGGFFIGLALELVVWTATSSRRHAAD